MNRVSLTTQGQGFTTRDIDFSRGLLNTLAQVHTLTVDAERVELEPELDWSEVDFTPEPTKPVKFRSFRHAAKMGMTDEWYCRELSK